MWKCKECGGEVFEISKTRINDYEETISYIDISHKCDECLKVTDDGINEIAEWVD